MAASTFFTFALFLLGFWLVLASRRAYDQARRINRLATGGPYARIRHPECVGFICLTVASFLQWPTAVMLSTLAVVTIACVVVARRDEREAARRFGDEWRRYSSRTPSFIPRL